jgi:glycosyltransferase involved in cell wall biosynthesis
VIAGKSAASRHAVLYVQTEFPADSETFVLREIESLRDMGLDIPTVLSLRPSRSTRPAPEDLQVLTPPGFLACLPALFATLLKHPLRVGRTLGAMFFDHLGELGWTRHGGTSLLKSLFLLPLSCWALARLNGRIQHVHAHFAGNSTSAAAQLARLGGISYSFTGHGSDVLVYPPRRLDRRIRQARFFVTVSGYNRDQILARFPALRREQIEVIPCGVETVRFAPPLARISQGTPIRLLSVARLDPVKALDRVLRALATPGLEAMHYTIVGEGPERATLETLICELNLASRVQLTGFKRTEDVVQRLHESDLFVLSSLSEGFPVVLMEAAAARLPILATRITAVPDIVEEGVNGLLVPPDDVEALREALLSLCAGEGSLLHSLQAGAAALDLARFDQTTTTTRLRELFHRHASC